MCNVRPNPSIPYRSIPEGRLRAPEHRPHDGRPPYSGRHGERGRGGRGARESARELQPHALARDLKDNVGVRLPRRRWKAWSERAPRHDAADARERERQKK